MCGMNMQKPSRDQQRCRFRRKFYTQGFRIVAAFDVNMTKVDKKVEGIAVFHLNQLTEVVAQKGIRLAIIAVPATAAQEVATALVDAGIDGILNFAPVTIPISAGISSIGVDLAIELEQLSFAVVNRPEKS